MPSRLQETAAQAPPSDTERLAALETRVALHDAILGLITPTATSGPPTATLTAIPDTATPVPTGTPIPLTETPTPTNTPVPPTGTPTHMPPTNTPVANTPTAPPVTASPVPVAGQPCPAWYHEQITATGPDGKPYPTWHPAVDAATGCYFGHEHGDDPRTSRANSAMPAFGYIGLLVGDAEPHVGFKVFVQNAGAVNNEGRTVAHHARMVFHQGTAGPKRFTTRFHSLEYDFVQVSPDAAGSGHEVHVKGMADTGSVTSVCGPIEVRNVSKGVMVLPNQCATSSLYEFWPAKLRIEGRVEVNASFALFDPITIMDAADPTRVLYTADYYPQFGGPKAGCDREAYSGPVYYYNQYGPTSFRTDAYGRLDPNGPLVQYVSQHNDLGLKMTTDGAGNQAKLASKHCKPGVKAPN